MADDYFPAAIAYNEATGGVVRNAIAQVFADTDVAFSNPLSITDLTGLPMPTLTSSDTGVYKAFKCPGYVSVNVVSGGVVTPMRSWFGVLTEVGLLPNTVPDLLRAAQAAQAAADAAAASAAEAAASAGGSGGGGGSGRLTYTGTAWPARPSTGVPQFWESTRHPTAPQPPAAIGDMWARHPDALEP